MDPRGRWVSQTSPRYQIKFLKPVVPSSQESLFYRMEFNTKADHRLVATIIGTNNEETFVKIQAEII